MIHDDERLPVCMAIVAMLFFIYTIITGNGHSFIIGIFFGAIAIVTSLSNIEYEDVTIAGLLIGIIGISLFFVPIGIFVACSCNKEMITVDKYNIYSAEVPYGMIYADTDGKISGFIGFNGELNTKLSEAYVVKYLVNDELYSITIDSSVPLKIDGELYLEKITTTSWICNTFWNYDISEHKSTVEYFIHIPQLPEMNMTLTDNYRIIG